MRNERQTRSTSRQDDTAGEEIEVAERGKDEPGDSSQQIDDLLDDIDEVLGEIENPEAWVQAFVQKGGQ